MARSLTIGNLKVIGSTKGSSFTGSFFSGSFIGDGTEIEGVLFDNIADKPTLVSSSIQVDHDQTTNFEADEHFLQEDITTVGTVTTGNVDAILPSNTVSSSIQVDHDQTTNFEADEHFTQADIIEVGIVTTGNVDAILPSNLISSSLQFNNLTSPFTGSFTGSFVGDGSGLTGVEADSVAFDDITGKPTLVSSSAQIDHDQTTNFEANEHFTQADITEVGIVTTGNVDAILPSNLVSSSLQFNDLTSPFTGSFTGSFVGDGTNLTGVGSVTSIGTTSPLTGGPITDTGTIGITQATTSTDGYLSSTDWNTFNDKTTCIGTVTSVGGTGTVAGITLSGTVTDSGNLTLGGTFSTTTSSISDFDTGVGTIIDGCGFTTGTGTVTGTGVNNQIATWNTTSELDGSSNLTFDGSTLNIDGDTKTNTLLVNTSSPIANSIITLKKANTSTDTDVGLFYDITKENTTDSVSESYGVVNRVDSTTDFNNRGIITQNNIGRVTGAGNFSYIYPSYNQASIKGAGTVGTVIAGVNETSLNNASGTVNYLWGTHTEVQLTAGTAGEISLLNFDFDQSAGTTITGDFQYINISNDQPVSNIGGTARALNIESNLPSFFSGSIGIGTNTPNDKLDVAGFIRTTGDDGGLLIGHGSGGYGIKIGRGRIGDGLAYLDFIGSEDPSGGTYDTRFFKNPGDNGNFDINHNGTGHFAINATGGGDILLLNGNVGIGTTSPGSKLEVAGDTANALLTLKSNSGGSNDSFMRFYDEATGPSYSVGLDSSDSKFKIAFDFDGDSLTTGTALVIDTGGNVGIGTDSPDPNYKLDVDGHISGNHLHLGNFLYWGSFTGGVQGASLESWPEVRTVLRSDNPRLEFYMGHSPEGVGLAMTLTSTGKLGIGVSNPNEKLEVDGNIKTVAMTATGDITANDFITTSDRRLKSNIQEITNGLETLKQFTSYEYEKDNRQDAGFIAQEVAEAIPYAVFTNDEGMLSMSDRPVIAHMHKAILELEKRIKNIENHLI